MISSISISSCFWVWSCRSQILNIVSSFLNLILFHSCSTFNSIRHHLWVKLANVVHTLKQSIRTGMVCDVIISVMVSNYFMNYWIKWILHGLPVVYSFNSILIWYFLSEYWLPYSNCHNQCLLYIVLVIFVMSPHEVPSDVILRP